VEVKAWQDLRSKIHHIKSYYGYLGNNSLIQKLVDWEQALRTNSENYNRVELMDELDRTLLIVAQLKQIVRDSNPKVI